MTNAILITDAGLAEVVNAEQSGTAPVAITAVAYGTGQYTPTGSQTALQAEFKRLTTISGGAVGANVIHLTSRDDSLDAYTVYEVGLFTASGTLFAVHSQTTPILQKAAQSQSLIAIDLAVSDFSAESVSFGDTNFISPPATTSMQGIVELATDEETQAGTDASRVITPKALQSLTAMTARAGLVALATDAEAEAGKNNAKAVTPFTLGKVLAVHKETAATADQLGHVKVGTGVNVNADGVISVDTPWLTRIASTEYTVGDIVDCPKKLNLELLCTQTGTTAAGDLAASSLAHGASVTDGTVIWAVRAKIKTVNAGAPDATGNVAVDVGVKTISGKGPDENGNIVVDLSTKRDHTASVANPDLNTLLEDKTWSCSGTIRNAPITTTFCIVQAYDTGEPISGNIVQVCYVPNLTDNTVRTFWRNCKNGQTFGKWAEAGAVKTVNGISPDATGNISIAQATSTTYGLLRTAAPADELDCSCDEAALTPKNLYHLADYRRASTPYVVGDKVECKYNFELFLECTTAGTTSTEALDTSGVIHDQVIPDGSAVWTVRTKIRSVNGSVPDASGNVEVDSGGVKTVNGTAPDESGDVTVNSGHSVGETWFSIDGTVPDGGIPFNGQLVPRDLWPGLLAWATAQGKVKPETEWQTHAIANGGNCPYYSDGDGSSTFRMPCIKTYLKGTGNVEDAGAFRPGNTNHTHATGWMNNNNGDFVATNAAKPYVITDGVRGWNGSGGGGGFSTQTGMQNKNMITSLQDNEIYPESFSVLVGVYGVGTTVIASDPQPVATVVLKKWG